MRIPWLIIPWLLLFGACGPGLATPVQQGATTYEELILSEFGLVGYWRLDETSGQAIDLIGGNSGTYGTAPSGMQPGAIVSDPANRYYNATSTNMLSIPGIVDYDFGMTADATIEAWVRVPAANPCSVGTEVLIGLNSATASAEITCSTSGASASFVDDAFTAFSTTAAGDPNDTLWHHMVATKHGNDVALFIDGVAVGGTTGAFTAGFTLNTGAFSLRLDTDFDEIAYYVGRAFTAETALQHYRMGIGEL